MALQNVFDMDTDKTVVAEAVWEDGYAIVEGAMSDDLLRAVGSDLQPHLDAAHSGHESFMGSLTKRFGALLAKSQACQQLLLHPTVLAAADRSSSKASPSSKASAAATNMTGGAKSQSALPAIALTREVGTPSTKRSTSGTRRSEKCRDSATHSPPPTAPWRPPRRRPR